MKKKKSIPVIMVSLSTFAVAGFQPMPAFAQVVVNCVTNLNIGRPAQCSDTATFVIRPDGGTTLSAGCVINKAVVKAGVCFVNTGGVTPLTKSVKIDFAKTFINMTNGGNIVKIDNLQMQYTATVAADTQFTLPKTDIINTVTVNIGGTVRITNDETLGSYSGGVVVRANPI